MVSYVLLPIHQYIRSLISTRVTKTLEIQVYVDVNLDDVFLLLL